MELKTPTAKRTVIDVTNDMHRKLKIFAIIDDSSVREVVDQALTSFTEDRLSDPKVKDLVKTLQND